MAAAGTRPAGDPGGALSARLTLLVMAGGLFLAVMSTTVVGVALPTIGRDLHASATGLEWIVDAYVIVYASLLAVGGVLRDRHGRTGLFMLGVAIFGLGALISGLAPGASSRGCRPARAGPGSTGRAPSSSHAPWALASGYAERR